MKKLTLTAAIICFMIGLIALFTMPAHSAGGLGSNDNDIAKSRLGKRLEDGHDHFGSPIEEKEQEEFKGFSQGVQVRENRQNRSQGRPKTTKLTKEEKRCKEWTTKARNRCKSKKQQKSRKCTQAKNIQVRWCEAAAK